MSGPANIIPLSETDGIPYATNIPLVGTEADLGDNAKTPAPISVVEGQTVVAVVALTVNGLIVGSNAYVVMQTLLGNQWVDVAWIVWTGGQGTGTFILCGGGLGAMNNAFQQSRQAGAFPASNGSNAVPLGGQIRFVGKAVAVGGSSSLAGTTAGLTATIIFKLATPR